MIKRGIVHEELSIDSHLRRENGSCPLMPEEVSSVLTFISSVCLVSTVVLCSGVSFPWFFLI